MRFIICVTFITIVFDVAYGETLGNNRKLNVSVRRKRGLIKDSWGVIKDIGRGVSKVPSAYNRWRRVTRAKNVLLSGAKLEKKDGNMRIYSKPGGLAEANRYFDLADPYGVKHFVDDDGIDWQRGTIGDKTLRITFGDNRIGVEYPTITMWRKNSPERGNGTKIKVYYKGNDVRPMFQDTYFSRRL